MTCIRLIAATVGWCLAAFPAMAMQDSVKQSMKYVSGLDDNCVYDDGYRCVETAEDDFISRDYPGRLLVPGPYLDAWAVSYRDFLSITEMNDEQKQLKHYKIGFTENGAQYIVLYQGLLLPMLENGAVVGTMRATFGLTTKYWVSKETLAIEKRLFLR